MSSNNIGLHCKACDAPLSEVDDAELCYECMAVVYQYNRKLIEANTDTDYWEVDDIDLIQPQEDDPFSAGRAAGYLPAEKLRDNDAKRICKNLDMHSSCHCFWATYYVAGTPMDRDANLLFGVQLRVEYDKAKD